MSTGSYPAKQSSGEFIRGLNGLRDHHRGCVTTIGSFDGVHLGHRSILTRLGEIAAQLKQPSLVIIFEPQPYEYFARGGAPARLSRLREKVNALFAAGVDRILCLKFDSYLRNLSAQEFIDDILIKQLGVSHLEIGDDFRFGCDRAGDFALLRQAGQKHGFTVEDTQTLLIDSLRVSSTRVRELLALGDLGKVETLLGRPYSVSGRVGYGQQIGRSINIPTANLALGRFRSPVSGVFAVDAKIEGFDEIFQGVANVGVRPTVSGQIKPLLEAHLFDFDEQIYGSCIEITFCKRLRPEKKFESLDTLKEQIELDIKLGKQYFYERL